MNSLPMMKARGRQLLGAVSVLAIMTTPAIADQVEKTEYPTDSVRLVVPFTPGGSTDAVARAFAKGLEDVSDASVVVINQPAGGGTVATQNIQRARPDGSQLLVSHSIISVAHAMGRSPISTDDLTTIATLNTRNNVYVAKADAPYDDLKQLFAYAKDHKLTIGTQLGGTSQIMAQALAAASDGNLRVVDAGDGSQRLTSLLGGQIDITIMDTTSAQEYSKSGDMKVLAVLSDQPDADNPEWPTASSQGVDISYPNVTVVYGPGNMDAQLAERLNKIAGKVVADPGFQQKMANLSLVPNYLSLADSKKFVDDRAAFIDDILSKQ